MVFCFFCKNTYMLSLEPPGSLSSVYERVQVRQAVTVLQPSRRTQNSFCSHPTHTSPKTQEGNTTGKTKQRSDGKSHDTTLDFSRSNMVTTVAYKNRHGYQDKPGGGGSPAFTQHPTSCMIFKAIFSFDPEDNINQGRYYPSLAMLSK